jgi:hypothetical protein
VFIRVWQYEVPSRNVERFLAAYGSSGDWARLFSRGSGYMDTVLYGAIGMSDRFITVDQRSDEEAWLTFLDEWRVAYEALDAALEGLAFRSRCSRDAVGTSTSDHAAMVESGGG